MPAPPAEPKALRDRSDTPAVPRVGIVAIVRNRRGVISSVTPQDGHRGRLHLVRVEYKDEHLPPAEDLIWELEPRRRLLEPAALPEPSRSDPMPVEDFDAVLRAARWTAASPYLDPDGDGPLDRLPISSPLHGAVQVDDFQLVPLLKALRMPRVSLLIADDVGLGKTIEAGLILSELLLRRRIQRILILTPASLRLQWRDEMQDKFALPFDLIDREETHALRRRLGMDANPWRSFSRIIASYHYLRQPDVLEQFLAACRAPAGSPHLPWDLLIVDECHNLMPSPFGEDSDLCTMLRQVAPQFEHRIFLSATPHNGHTRCFTGLLEILDPVRFNRTDELKPAERVRIPDVVLRRLKREINARTNPPKFCTRHPPRALALTLSAAETRLHAAFAEFRAAIRELIARERQRRRAGSFAVEILGKRLLSCPTAFAESWHRCQEGLASATAAADADVETVRRTVARETADDREMQSREATAAGVVGAWMKSVEADLAPQMAAINGALDGLGLGEPSDGGRAKDPSTDARLEALIHRIEELLRPGATWLDDERLVVFTEYKTTLDYLARRLRERYDEDRILTLFGGMDEFERDRVKHAFNDPAATVRILLGTDAAAEGLNLHATARYVLHFDCPWNPSKLEQRNGRVDRHGQARDVTIHHFVTEQDQDLKFLAHVIKKADEIREDLGSVNELFDEAAHRRLVEGESAATVQADLDRRIATARGRANVEADSTTDTGAEGRAAADQLAALSAELDLTPPTLHETLESAMAIRAGRPQLECAGSPATCRILSPSLPGWAEVIDTSLRRAADRTTLGPVAGITFTPEALIEDIGGRKVFRPRSDVALLHLSHPMLQRALSLLTRCRYPDTGDEVSRWTVRLGGVPQGADALVLLSVEEMAVNDLRETFHHWVRTLAFPIRGGVLGPPLPHRPASQIAPGRFTPDTEHHDAARTLFEEVRPELRRVVLDLVERTTTTLRAHLETAGTQARREADERYRSRQGELSALIVETTLAKLEREIAAMKAERAQGVMFDEAGRLDALDRSIAEKEAELDRRRRHVEEIREQLERERTRILQDLLPRRHAMSSPAQVFPVVVEVRLP